ncbi:MAG TPA: HEAT repeat domain-containing protein [Bryobacteraceae bacterium]|nr:HEAT repeat domain-containing protein [Bryobacteraceae bacterium]
MQRILGIVMFAGLVAGTLAAQAPRPAKAPAVPVPKFKAEIDVDLVRLKSELAAMELEMAGVDMHLKGLPALPPLPPLPAMPADFADLPALADLPETAAPLASMAEKYAMLAQVGVAQPQPPQPAQLPQPRQPTPFHYGKAEARADSYYGRGMQHLDRREWDRAIEAFDQVIERKGTRSEGAYYWKAYALNKLGRGAEGLAAIGALRKNHPGSRWLDDAKALELELKQASGRPVSPDSVDDEEIKLIAINSLINSDPERAVPLLERTLQQSNSPRLKERALFVLASATAPRAHDVVARIAKGGANPDLQIKAVEYLGIHRGADNAAVLADVYKSTQDVAVKKAVLRGFMVSRRKDRLLAAAKAEAASDLRREAIHLLGVSGGQAELTGLFSSESDPELRREMVRAFMVGNNREKLVEIARTDKDVNVRREAIRNLGQMDRGKAGDTLVSLYANESDKGIRQEIARALFHQENAKALIEIARKETDPQVKRDLVRLLSNMDTKEARDFLMELLK